MESPYRPNPHAGAPAFRIPGLRREISRLCGLLSLGDADIRHAQRCIERLHRILERGLEWHGMDAGGLTPASREVRGWLAFFARDGNLVRYHEAVCTAREQFLRRIPSQRRFRAPIRIEFRPQRALAWIRAEPDGARVPCCTPAMSFDRAAFADLAEDLLHRRRSRPLHEAMLQASFQETAAELEALGGMPDHSTGRHHDLAAAFDRVNRQFFESALPRPRLAWSRTQALRVLGRYEPVRDTVLISAALDRPEVSERLVEYILYHELLHKKLGIRWSGGTARVHTPAFRTEERRFPEWRQAEAEIRRLTS